jgi:hypothetical protein
VRRRGKLKERRSSGNSEGAHTSHKAREEMEQRHADSIELQFLVLR